MRYCLMALALMAASGSGAAAHAQPAAAPATGTVVRVPFQPPMGRPLPYAMTITRQRGPSVTVMKLRQTLTFRAEGSGFVLTIAYRSVEQDGRTYDLTDPAMLAVVPPAWRPLVTSASYDLDDSGAIVRVRDWATLQKAFAGLPAAAAAQAPPADRERLLSALNRLFQPLTTMAAEAAPAMLLRGWPQFLGTGGMEGANGEAQEERVENTTPLLPIPIPSIVRLSVTKQANGTLHVATRSQPDRAAVTKAMSDFMAKMRPDVAPEEVKAFDEAVEQMRTMDIQDGIDVTLDGTSGVVRKAVQSRKVSASGGEASVERVEVELVG